ncbi:MAG: calcium/proton exchanger, partial [Gemmatimonadales bacterium]
DQGSLLARLLAPAGEGRPAPKAEAPAPVQAEVAVSVRESPRPSREPAKRKERPAKPERPPREDKPARAERRPSAPRPPQEDDDEPPFVPRLAVQPRKPWKFRWRALLLLLVPATIYLNVTGADPLLLFVVAALGVLPLAAYLGEATEHIAARTGPTIGGLLNATFGNAAELIIAIMALQAGLVTLVKATIIGSMLGNLLLILGLSLLAGGLKSPIIRFNRTAAGMSSAMLALAVVALVLPAMLFQVHPRPEELNAFRMSEVAAIILGLTYLCSLLFSLHTHRSLFGGDPEHAPVDTWPAARSVAVLLLATAAVVVQSEVLVHAVEQVTVTLGWSELFLGLIIIPLIGNAAEHASAILVARKGKMDLALHIALGSSTQIALLVAPVLVAVGLVIGVRMDLVFTPFEVMCLAMATIVTAIITLDGESHWYEGVQLLAVYALMAAAAWFI